jgi:hypothetical protein
VSDAVVRVTALIATVMWAAAEVLKIRRPQQIEPARRLWTAALLLALVHAAAAFHVAYGWSHQAASVDTTRQAADVTGITFPGAILVNYVFLSAWLADTGWWWIAAVGYLRRSMTLERARLILFLFMFFNGAVVFASNAARLVGIPSVGAVCLTWMLGPRRHPARA